MTELVNKFRNLKNLEHGTLYRLDAHDEARTFRGEKSDD